MAVHDTQIHESVSYSPIFLTANATLFLFGTFSFVVWSATSSCHGSGISSSSSSSIKSGVLSGVFSTVFVRFLDHPDPPPSGFSLLSPLMLLLCSLLSGDESRIRFLRSSSFWWSCCELSVYPESRDYRGRPRIHSPANQVKIITISLFIPSILSFVRPADIRFLNSLRINQQSLRKTQRAALAPITSLRLPVSLPRHMMNEQHTSTTLSSKTTLVYC